jgi:hypothetical protein
MSQVFKAWISECPSFWVKHYGNPNIFTKYTNFPTYNGLSDQNAQLLTVKDINLWRVNHHSYNIRNINKYSIEEFKIRLSYESWHSVFGNNDNVDVGSVFNICLNNYTSFPLRKITERDKRRRWITTGIKPSRNPKKRLYLLSKDTNNINLIKHYKQ